MNVSERLMTSSNKRNLQNLAAQLQFKQRIFTMIDSHMWRAANFRSSELEECEFKVELNDVSFILDLVDILIFQS